MTRDARRNKQGDRPPKTTNVENSGLRQHQKEGITVELTQKREDTFGMERKDNRIFKDVPGLGIATGLGTVGLCRTGSGRRTAYAGETERGAE